MLEVGVTNMQGIAPAPLNFSEARSHFGACEAIDEGGCLRSCERTGARVFFRGDIRFSVPASERAT